LGKKVDEIPARYRIQREEYQSINTDIVITLLRGSGNIDKIVI